MNGAIEFRPGLPDGILAYPKSQIRVWFAGPWNGNVGIFHGYLVHFIAIWCIFPILVYILYKETSGNPDSDMISD
jgi:hypothetical protein